QGIGPGITAGNGCRAIGNSPRNAWPSAQASGCRGSGCSAVWTGSGSQGTGNSAWTPELEGVFLPFSCLRLQADICNACQRRKSHAANGDSTDDSDLNYAARCLRAYGREGGGAV